MSELKGNTELESVQYEKISKLEGDLDVSQNKILQLEKELETAQLKIAALESATYEAIPASTTEHTFKIGKAKFKLLYPSFIIGSTTILSEDAVNDAELLALIVKDYPSLCEAL